MENSLQKSSTMQKTSIILSSEIIDVFWINLLIISLNNSLIELTLIMKKKYISLIIFVFYAFFIQANTYYISSSSGSDLYSKTEAQNSSTPWKSLQKLQEYMPQLQAGDSILFLRGDVFYGNLKVVNSGTSGKPIVFSTYGTGTNPIISGFQFLEEWNAYTGNIYSASCPACMENENLFIKNNTLCAKGRYPNATVPNQGYNLFESHINDTLINDTDEQNLPDFTGGEIVIRKNHWIIDRYKITGMNEEGIHFAPTSAQYPLVNNTGYFIQSHINTLDSDGEWYYDPINKTMYVYSESGIPSNSECKTSVQDILIDLSQRSYITISNIDFQGANSYTFILNNASNIIIQNSSITYSGNYVFTGYDFSDCVIENNTITHTQNDVLFTYKCTRSIFRNNKISHTALHEGMGQNGDMNHLAVSMYGNYNTIENNIIDSTGYIPIYFFGDYVTVRNNFITTYGLIKDDVGGINTWTGAGNTSGKGNFITGNIILNSAGALKGAIPHGDIQANGIYMDDNTSGVTIDGNTIAHCQGAGIFLHNTQNIICRNNTVYDNTVSMQFSHQDETCVGCKMEENRFSQNIFVSKGVGSPLVKLNSFLNDVDEIFTADSNYYGVFKGMNSRFIVSDISSNNIYSIEDWRQAYKADINGQSYELDIPMYSINSISTNSILNGDFTTNVNGVYAWSEVSNYSTVYDPNSPLNGGALKLSYSNFSGFGKPVFVIANAGAVDSEQDYIVNFSAYALKPNKTIGVYLRKNDEPYSTLTPMQYVKLQPKAEDFELLFRHPVTEQNMSVVFQTTDSDSTLWLDNISMQQADVETTNLNKYTLFEYNASNQNKTIAVPDTMYDIHNKTYSGSVTLEPFTSIVLFNKSIRDTRTRTNSRQLKQNNFTVYPNPVENILHISLPEEMQSCLNISILDTSGKRLSEKNTASSVLTIDVSLFPKGNYILFVRGNKNQYSTVFVKN